MVGHDNIFECVMQICPRKLTVFCPQMILKCLRLPVLVFIWGGPAPSYKMSKAAWLHPTKCSRLPGSILLKRPRLPGSVFKNVQELVDKHFQCPRMPGSVFCQIIVRWYFDWGVSFIMGIPELTKGIPWVITDWGNPLKLHNCFMTSGASSLYCTVL